MNPFYNPGFILKMAKSYLFDIERLYHLSESDLKKYQDKQLRKMVDFAYTVPLYHQKYKKAGVQPSDISGIKDILKLPVISKYDIKNHYPDRIISNQVKKNQLIEIATSGTTGKSLSLFGDIFDMVLWLFWYIRVLREHQISWRKDRLTIIADFAPHTIGTGYINQGLLLNTGGDRFFKNMQWLNTNGKPEELIKQIDQFKPDFIGGYVGMLGHLALLKENGQGENICPKNIATIGSVLTNPLRNLIEDAFNANIFEVYGATESGTIAFQCKDGSYHVMGDLVYPEFYMDGKPVKSREPGKMIITKLYGFGTPIIRYDAVNDLVAPRYDNCGCGIPGMLLEKVYGRDDLTLYFTEGRVLLPSTISEIHGKLLYELKTNLVKHTRIIQHSKKKIEIKLVIDEKQKKKGITNEKIFSLLRDEYHKRVGEEVEIDIKKVQKVSKKGPRIVTKVNKQSFKIKKYL